MAAPAVAGRVALKLGWIAAGFVIRKLAGTEAAEEFKEDIKRAVKDLGEDIKRGGFVCSPYDKNYKR